MPLAYAILSCLNPHDPRYSRHGFISRTQWKRHTHAHCFVHRSYDAISSPAVTEIPVPAPAWFAFSDVASSKAICLILVRSRALLIVGEHFVVGVQISQYATAHVLCLVRYGAELLGCPGWQVIAFLAAVRSPPTYDHHGVGEELKRRYLW